MTMRINGHQVHKKCCTRKATMETKTEDSSRESEPEQTPKGDAPQTSTRNTLNELPAITAR